MLMIDLVSNCLKSEACLSHSPPELAPFQRPHLGCFLQLKSCFLRRRANLRIAFASLFMLVRLRSDYCMLMPWRCICASPPARSVRSVTYLVRPPYPPPLTWRVFRRKKWSKKMAVTSYTDYLRNLRKAAGAAPARERERPHVQLRFYE